VKFKFIVLFCVFMISFIILGCFSKGHEENVKLSKGMVAEQKDEGVKIFTKDVLVGAEIEINGIIEELDIEIPENYMVIQTSKDYKTILSLAFVGGEEGNIEFLLKNSSKDIEIKLLKTISKQDLAKKKG